MNTSLVDHTTVLVYDASTGRYSCTAADFDAAMIKYLPSSLNGLRGKWTARTECELSAETIAEALICFGSIDREVSGFEWDR